MIVDNNSHNCQELGIDTEQWELLRDRLSHRTVRSLCEDKNNPNLLIFPHCLGDRRKEFCDTPICSIMDDTITTNNLMGFVGVQDGKVSAELSIRSRFHKDNEQDYFLHYMLQKVFHFNIFNLPTSSGDSESFEFILFHLFTHYLKKAMKQGIFKQYRKCEYNDANVRGVIDIPRHIRYNMPFNGKVAYRTSEYKYDNPVTQLIRHTIESIRRSPIAGNVLKCDKSTDEVVRTIYDITPSYNANDRQRIINQNLKPVKHPFYTQYTFLQRLCLHILCHKKMSYSSSENKVYGILFDGAWLWEEYLATILCEKGFIHAVKGEGNGIKFFKEGSGAHQRFPDFYSLENGGIVLDAKYKNIDSGMGQREDQFQLIAYMHTLDGGKVKGASLGALVYPSENERVGNRWELKGCGGTYAVIPIVIPNSCESIKDFGVRIEETISKIDFVACRKCEIALCEE